METKQCRQTIPNILLYVKEKKIFIQELDALDLPMYMVALLLRINRLEELIVSRIATAKGKIEILSRIMNIKVTSKETNLVGKVEKGNVFKVSTESLGI